MIAITVRTKAFGLPAGRYGNARQDIITAPAAGHVKLPGHRVILIRAGKILDLGGVSCGVQGYGRYQADGNKNQGFEQIISQTSISFD